MCGLLCEVAKFSMVSDEANVVYNLPAEITPKFSFLPDKLAPLLRLMQQDHDLHSQTA